MPEKILKIDRNLLHSALCCSFNSRRSERLLVNGRRESKVFLESTLKHILFYLMIISIIIQINSVVRFLYVCEDSDALSVYKSASILCCSLIRPRHLILGFSDLSALSLCCSLLRPRHCHVALYYVIGICSLLRPGHYHFALYYASVIIVLLSITSALLCCSPSRRRYAGRMSQ